MKYAARGVTVLISSGDAGAPGRTNEFCESQKTKYGYNNMNAVFPGGSPYVTAVGATYLVADSAAKDPAYTTPICSQVQCATGSEERGVTQSIIGWTSGSGFTHWADQPSYQKAAVQGYLNSGVQLPGSKYFNANKRAYPDVSAIGHMCQIIDGGFTSAEDGTSCSAPIFAGVVAHLNAYQKSKGRPVLGFANPLFYKMHAAAPNTFHDVLHGDSAATEDSDCQDRNFGFLAAKGWDPVGGLGTPDVGAIKNYLDAHAAKRSTFTQQ